MLIELKAYFGINGSQERKILEKFVALKTLMYQMPCSLEQMSDQVNLLHHQTPSGGFLPPAEVSFFRYISPQCQTYSEGKLEQK